jgi:hypothetical protein
MTDMIDIHDSAQERDTRLEDLAAELTSTVYPLLLRRRLEGSWLKLELGLWRALAETFRQWARQLPSAALCEELETGRYGLLAELTESAVCVALDHGIHAIQAEAKLYQVFQQTIRRCIHGY